MHSNWDLFILDPILIFIGILILSFMFYKEKISIKSLIFYIEIILFWAGMAILTKHLSREFLQNTLDNISFTILMFFSSVFIGIILKPIATWLTARINNRRIWIWISYATAMIGILLLIVNNYNHFLWINIITSILLGFSISSNTVYYLFLNEQFYYRINPVGVTWTVAIAMLFASFLGMYINDLNIAIWKNNLPISLIIGFIFTATSLGISFVKKENKDFVGSFEKSIREQYPPKDIPIFFIMCLMSILISVANSLVSGNTIKMFIAILYIRSEEKDQIIMFLRLFEYMFVFVSVIFGYFIFRYIFKSLGYKYTLLTNAFILFIVYTLFAFIHNGTAYIILNMFAGIAYFQIIYGIFSISVFWNYRIVNIPITGYVSASVLLGKYVVDNTESLLVNNKVGPFKICNNLNWIFENKNLIRQDFDTYFDAFNDMVTITSSIAALIILVVILILYLSSNRLLRDFSNFKLAMTTMKNNYKKNIIDKTKLSVENKLGEKYV